jgi:hypothetical protein
MPNIATAAIKNEAAIAHLAPSLPGGDGTLADGS